MTMTALTILLYDILPRDVLSQAILLGARGSMKYYPAITNWTGANLIWGIGNTIRHALLTEDAELLSLAARRMAEEITVGKPEGIQNDAAFRQHGPRWYSGGYGGSFLFNVSELAYVLSGTDWAVPTEHMNILLTHVLDGLRQMMLHGYFDYNGVGRELTRQGSLAVPRIHESVDLLLHIEGIPRKEELLAFAAENHGAYRGKTDIPYAETKYYPSISYLAHNARGVHIGVKCHASDQYDMEICNSEAILCYNMSYGTRTCHMARGDEYFDINPYFDYAHLPGTTARYETDEELLAHPDFSVLPLPTDCTYGTARDGMGIVSELAVHDGITVRAAYFTYEGRMIALGTDITDEHPERGSLFVTVEQCRAVDAISADGDGVASCGSFSYQNLEDGGTLTTEIALREGSWHRNNLDTPYAKISGELFLAYIPVSGEYGHYAYAVYPREATAAAHIIENNSRVQAILTDSGILLAVFHEDGALTVDGKSFNGKSGDCLIQKANEV